MSASELDVVAVYTARSMGDGNQVSTMHVLPVPGSKQREDFSIDR
jgi:hypothetical protein